jgi:hypothetical protein
MANSPAQRTLRLPPSNLAAIKLARTTLRTGNWFRVHQTTLSATTFSLNPIHRYSHKDCPFPFLYLGADVDTCLFERFGDLAYDNKRAIPQSIWYAHSLSLISVPDLIICDLTSPRTLSSLMVDLSALMHTTMDAPQEWGLALQRHPENFQGLKFRSRFNGKACLALFQRDGLEKRLKEKHLNTLPNNDDAVDWLAKHEVGLY